MGGYLVLTPVVRAHVPDSGHVVIRHHQTAENSVWVG